MSDIELRARCVEMAISVSPPGSDPIGLAKRMFDWISQGYFGPSDLPSDDQQKLKAA